MEEQEGFVIFEVKIPVSAMALVEYAAKADGWTPTVADANGNQVPNPVSAVRRIFEQTVRMATAQAINQMAAEKANEARMLAMDEMQALATTWQAAMAPVQQEV